MRETKYLVFTAVLEFAKKFGNLPPDDIAKKFSGKRGGAPDGVRSVLDEAKRMTVEELNELQRCVLALCICGLAALCFTG